MNKHRSTGNETVDKCIEAVDEILDRREINHAKSMQDMVETQERFLKYSKTIKWRIRVLIAHIRLWIGK